MPAPPVICIQPGEKNGRVLGIHVVGIEVTGAADESSFAARMGDARV